MISQILSYYRALGFTPGAEIWVNTYTHGTYSGNYHGDRIELWKCRKAGTDTDGLTVWQRDRRIDDPIAKLRSLGMVANVQAYPNHLHGGLGNKHAQRFTSLFYEIDDLSLEEQRAKLEWVRSHLGLDPAAVVFSGSKSLHVYFALTDAIDADTWQRLNRMLAIVVGGDPAICTHARAMRLPGVPRVKNGETREVTLEQTSEAKYNAADIESRLAPWFPHGLSYQRWLKWRRDGDGVLSIPEDQLTPKRDYQPVDFVYDGSEVPLELCLTRADCDAIANGAPKGDGNNTGFRLARNLIATADYLTSQGIRFAPTARDLFDDFAGKTELDRGEDESIWRSAGRGNPTPARTPESINNSIAWHQRQSDPIARFAKRPRTITREEWIERFGHSELCDLLNRAVRRSSNVIDFLKEKRQQQAEEHRPGAIEPNHTETAIVLYRPDWNWGQDLEARIGLLCFGFEAGNLKLATMLPIATAPTRREWIDRHRPKIIIPGWIDQADLWLALGAEGFPCIFDSTEAGSGKSHIAGELGQRVASGSPAYDRAIFFSKQYRNPATESVEAATEMPTRHNGLVTDFLRRTATGQPHRIRPQQGITPDIPGNCPKSDVFAAAAGRDVKLFGGKDSPICQGCPLFGGCQFLRDRAIALGENGARFLRADLAQLPTLRATDIAIIDEASQEIAGEKVVEISLSEIEAELTAITVAPHKRTDLAATEAANAETIATFLYLALDRLLSGKQDYHGLSHQDILEALPSLNQLRSELPSRGCGWVAKRDIDCGQIQMAKRTIDKILAPDLNIFGEDESPEVQLSRVQQLHKNAIGKVLAVVMGDRSINLATRHGNLIITRRDRRHGRTVRSAGLSILMDATGNKRDLARKLGMNPDEIIEVQRAKAGYSNLNIQIINGIGGCGRLRRDSSIYDSQHRINKLIEAIAPEAVIDFKGKTDRYWGRDNRGSNEFKSMSHIAAIGLPTPNLGAMAAQYHVTTGHAVDPTDRTGGYGAFVRRAIAAEIVQLVGRPRAQWRPDEAITVTLVGDGFVQYQGAIAEAFPGATIEVIDVASICLAAATKGEQTAHAIVNNIVKFAQDGKAITRQSVAEATGHSNPSKALKDRLGVTLTDLKQAVTFVLEALNTKVTVDWSGVPEQLRDLLVETFGLSESLRAEDIDAAAAIIAEAIQDAHERFGAELTIEALSCWPIGYFDPLLEAIGAAIPIPIATATL